MGLKDIWLQFLQNEAKVWSLFHHYWLTQFAHVPMISIRYEDLLSDSNQCIQRITQFLLEGKPPLGLRRFIPQKNTVSNSGPGYKPKNKVLGKSLQVMPKKSIEAIWPSLENYSTAFGYTLQQTMDQSEANTMTEQHLNMVQENIPSPPSVDHTYILNIQSLDMSSIDSLRRQTSSRVGEESHVTINNHISIRDKDDIFGRKITELRRKFTDNDKSPFPTR